MHEGKKGRRNTEVLGSRGKEEGLGTVSVRCTQEPVLPLQLVVAMDIGCFDLCPCLEAHFRILGHQKSPMEIKHDLAELKYSCRDSTGQPQALAFSMCFNPRRTSLWHQGSMMLLATRPILIFTGWAPSSILSVTHPRCPVLYRDHSKGHMCFFFLFPFSSIWRPRLTQVCISVRTR